MCCCNICNIVKNDCFWIILILLVLWGCCDNGCGNSYSDSCRSC